MLKRRPPADPTGVIDMRDRLVRMTKSTTLGSPLGDIQVSNLPLFRQGAAGLEQTVRFLLPAGDHPDAITLRLRDGNHVVAETSARLGDHASSVHLFAHEVSAPRPVTAEVSTDEGAVSTAAFDIEPQRKLSIHLVHHSHYDIGYTDPQTVVMEAQLDYIDAALEFASLTDAWPDDSKFRWNVEVNWPLRQWLRTRPKHDRDTFVRRVNEGRIEVHALPFSMHTEAYSQDELARQLEFARDLREDLGIEITTAMQTDVPGSTIGLASLLTDTDVRYLAVAHNYAGISIPWLNGGQELDRPFWWEAPDGERLLVWYTDTLYGNAYMEAMGIGFGHGYAAVVDALPEYLNSVMQNGYPISDGMSWLNLTLEDVEFEKQPYAHDILHLRVMGHLSDNAPSSILPAEIVREWNENWAWPRLRSSIDRDFFVEAEATLGEKIPTYKGDWTDWWALGVGTAAFALGKNRKSQNDIKTAQTLHALADHVTDEPLATIRSDVRSAYEEMALFDEHTWGAANPWATEATGASSGAYQWVRKEAFAYVAEEKTQALLRGGMRRLGALAARPDTARDVHAMLVFNGSSWTRTDLVEVFVPRRGTDPEHVVIVDLASGERIPAVVAQHAYPTHQPLGVLIRFVARDVPGLGYRRYALERGEAGDEHKTADPRPSIANQRLRLDVDLASATVTSVIDLQNDRELVEPDTPFGFNGHIYDRYTTAPGFNHLSSRLGNGAGPWLLGSRRSGSHGLIVDRTANGVYESLTVRYAVDGADWAETRYTLPHGTARLHIRNRLMKPSNMGKESLFYAFPFADTGSRIDLQITGGLIGPDSPVVPGSADHYRSMGHWATITRDGAAPIGWATAEAALVQIGNIRIPYAPFVRSIPEWNAHPATIYSWALNNIWDTNFPPQQGGELAFSYAIGLGGEDAIALGRDTGASVSSPLIGFCASVDSIPVKDLPDADAFITIDHPAVEITHLSPGRYGGIAATLFSLAAEPVTIPLRIDHLPILSVAEATFLETNPVDLEVANGVVHVDIAPGETKTVVMRLDR